MALNYPVFFQRLGSAIVYVAVMLFCLLFHIWTTIFLACLIQVLCFREYFRLLKKIEPDTYWPPSLPFIVQAISLVWLLLSSIMYSYQTPWPALICAPAFILAFSILPQKSGWQAGMQSLAGMFYIMLPMMLLVQVRVIGTVIPIAILFMIWTSDTMAYLVGSFIGKTPFSSISPNKTWEGTIGGAILTIVIGGAFGYVFKYYNVIDWMILSLIVSITAPIGDLVKSRLKRMAGVKDSGKLMPGHGGALDRFDSLLFALPFTFCYIWFYMPNLHIALF